jgi:biotin operon repressor
LHRSRSSVSNFISGLKETGINISAAPSAIKMVSGSDR